MGYVQLVASYAFQKAVVILFTVAPLFNILHLCISLSIYILFLSLSFFLSLSHTHTEAFVEMMSNFNTGFKNAKDPCELSATTVSCFGMFEVAYQTDFMKGSACDYF
jgi:hypothetical protein